MKWKQYSIIFVISFLVGIGIYVFISQFNSKNNNEQNTEAFNDYVSFSVKYNLELNNNELVPNKILKTKENKTTSVKKFLKITNVEYILNNFEIENDKDFYKKGIIIILPNRNEMTKKYNRLFLSNNFFVKYNLRINISTKFVNILNDNNISLDDCYEKLNEIYKKDNDVLEFIKVALPLIVY
ncbi:hypothetical protein SCORR_v1c04510 [Spiroplasma corruscae]|uniref:Uncharacterized protein n=1 Tax=Spiroplasma corruscae TaxID=216934 RepID=A0A222EPK2_9MOLU|nr:hypothetical protein [Spiroplasma corruscae]ASP28223.1 hypothetical protein SCORR_v1c04510 [Spiroplasma corruscae]